SSLSASWWGGPDPGRVDRVLRRALDEGITLFDTADVVGKGTAEEILGRALRGRRWEVTLATKGGYDFTGSTRPRFLEAPPGQAAGGSLRFALSGGGEPSEERPQDFRPRALREACERSLRRLGSEVIDLYQLHHPRWDVLERDDVRETLDALQREGKILHYGI